MVIPILDAWRSDGLALTRFDASGPIENLAPFAAHLASSVVE